MLMAFAPPAARVPPTSVATTRPNEGRPPGRHDHGRDGRDQQQLDDPGLGERHVGRKVRPARAHAR